MTEKIKTYTWKGLLFNFIWRLVIPGFFIWLIPYMLDNGMINQRKWEDAIVGLMVALIVGSGINFFYLIYYLFRVILEPSYKDERTGKIN